LILQELEKHYQREKVLRNVSYDYLLNPYLKKLNILEGQIIELRSESKFYKEKYKEAQRQYKEERVGNENDLLHLKKILSE